MEHEEGGVGDATRSRLIDATMESISINGMADTTTSKISSLANVSTATIHHYFDSKDNLLYETMLHLLRLIGDRSKATVSCAITPRAKIAAIVESVSLSHAANFENTSSAWFAFWAQSDHVPNLNRLMFLYIRRLQTNLHFHIMNLLQEELPGTSHLDRMAERLTEGVTALLHGTFVSLSLGEGRLTSASSLLLIDEYIDMAITARRPEV